VRRGNKYAAMEAGGGAVEAPPKKGQPWWRGKAGGQHQLVVTMEDLTGPNAVPIRILRIAVRREPLDRWSLR
jgi:hypothetical protein